MTWISPFEDNNEQTIIAEGKLLDPSTPFKKTAKPKNALRFPREMPEEKQLFPVGKISSTSLSKQLEKEPYFNIP